MKKNKKVYFALLLASLLLFIGLKTSLATSIVDTSNPDYKTGNYDLSDVGNYAIYIIELILSLVGTLSLIAFIYGGVTFLISAGSSDKVKKGMDIIKAAVVGLIITFSSVLIMNLFFSGLGVSWNPNTGAVSSSPKK